MSDFFSYFSRGHEDKTESGMSESSFFSGTQSHFEWDASVEHRAEQRQLIERNNYLFATRKGSGLPLW